MEPRTNHWSPSALRVLVRRKGPARKTEKELPVGSEEIQEGDSSKAQKINCFFEETELNSAESSRTMRTVEHWICNGSSVVKDCLVSSLTTLRCPFILSFLPTYFGGRGFSPSCPLLSFLLPVF